MHRVGTVRTIANCFDCVRSNGRELGCAMNLPARRAGGSMHRSGHHSTLGRLEESAGNPRIRSAPATTALEDRARIERRLLLRLRRRKLAESSASLLTAQQRRGVGSDCVCKPRSSNRTLGYTRGLKVAVSIPNELFDRVERLRRQERSSRSKLVAVALSEYVARHAGDEVTEAMNRVCEDVDTEPDEFTRTASRRVLERSEW